MTRLRCAAVLVCDKGIARGHLVNVATEATACGLDATNAHPIDLRSARLNCPTCNDALQELGYLVQPANIGVPA